MLDKTNFEVIGIFDDYGDGELNKKTSELYMLVKKG